MSHKIAAVYAFLTWVALFLGGCQSITGRPQAINLLQDDSGCPGTSAKKKNTKTLTWIECELIGLENDYDDPKTKAPARRTVRDRFARKMIALTDQRYNEFVNQLVTRRKRLQSLADIGSIGMDAASTLVTPTTTKNLLTQSSLLTQSGKTTINKVYFYEQTLSVMVSQMSADRQTVLADIHQGLRQDVANYPLHRLLADLQRYYTAGTIDGALQKIQRQAGEKEKSAEEKMAQLVDVFKAETTAIKTKEKRAREMVQNKESFDKLKEITVTWWKTLEEEKKLAQITDIKEYTKDESLDVENDSVVTLIENLKHDDSDDQNKLVNIVKNAHDLELP